MKIPRSGTHEQVACYTWQIIVLGAFAEGFITNKLVVSGDAATTARNILTSPELWRLGVAGDLIVVLCAAPLLWIEYLLLRPVSRQLVLLAVLFNLVSPAVEAISKLSCSDAYLGKCRLPKSI